MRIGDLLLPYYTLTDLYPNMDGPRTERPYYALVTGRQESALGCALCSERDCLNGGRCSDPANTFACTCPIGFTGDDCSIDVNECDTGACKNNATCIDGRGNYTCVCQTGWEGWL